MEWAANSGAAISPNLFGDRTLAPAIPTQEVGMVMREIWTTTASRPHRSSSNMRVRGRGDMQERGLHQGLELRLETLAERIAALE